MDELQRIVDSLGRATRRAVAVHDSRRRLLAYNSHEGPVDEVRTAAILTRQGPERSFAWALSLGIDRAEGPMRLPGNAELAMEPRVCAPIRFESRLLGYLWLLDPDESLTDRELETVAAAAENAGLAMHHETLRSELERGRERELLRDLLSEREELQTHAADELIGSRLLVPLDRMVAVVLRPVRGRDPVAAEDSVARRRMETALNRARDELPSRQALTLVRPDHGVLLVTVRNGATRPEGPLERAAVSLQRMAAELLGTHGDWTPLVGIGDARGRLTEAELTYRHARQAAEVSAVVRSFGPVTRWDDLGVYQTLVDLPVDGITSSRLHPGLSRLLESREAETWLRTLEVYLDTGCDARAAARALNIQRGSLYHRLTRIEEIAGVELRSGSDRLALHLGLKVARLAGLLDTPAATR